MRQIAERARDMEIERQRPSRESMRADLITGTGVYRRWNKTMIVHRLLPLQRPRNPGAKDTAHCSGTPTHALQAATSVLRTSPYDASRP
jgi:hypothetical protein